MRSFALACVLLLSACELYFDDDHEPPCDFVGEPDIALAQVRDPQTGLCESLGNPCDDRCGPCAAALVAAPDWGSCSSTCDGLAESACVAEPGCFAAYLHFDTDIAPEYRGCYQTAPSGPVQGSCAGLDAQACSRHDDCTAHYREPAPNHRTTPRYSPQFEACRNEVARSCADVRCEPGTTCEEECTAGGDCQPRCVPTTNACDAVDCGPGWSCSVVCAGENCGAQCVPAGTCEAIATEPACATRPDCERLYIGDDCTCTPTACGCNVLTYDRCVTK